MKSLKNIKWNKKTIAKLIGWIVLGILLISAIISAIVFSVRSVGSLLDRSSKEYDSLDYGYATSSAPSSYDGDFYYGEDEADYDKFYEYEEGGLPIEPGVSITPGIDAENYEIITYWADIRTRTFDGACQAISSLKIREEVIFENSNEGDYSCYYTFKVKKEMASEILTLIESLNPRDLSTSIRTIKKQIEGVDTELDILQKKLTAVEETLQSAQTDFDSISNLATSQNDVETLGVIVDKKLQLIERLTNERLNLISRIDQYNKQRDEWMDQINYSIFEVSITKDVVFDWQNIKENWKMEARNMINNISGAFQVITLNLVNYFFYIAVGTLYLFLSLFLVKWVWKGIKRVWKGEDKSSKKRS